MQLGEPDASGRRRPEPAPGHRVHDPVRPRAAGHRPGPRARLGRRARQRGRRGDQERRLKADAVTFSTGRPGVFGTGDVRIGAATVVEAGRRGPARGLRGRRLPQGHGPRRDPHPPDAGRAAARVPLDRAVHRRGQGAALPAEAAPGRGAQPTATSSTSCRTRARRRWRNRPAACSARARRSGSATCAGSASSTARRSPRSSRTTTRAPATDR